MKLRDRIKPWAQDLAMRFMDDLRPDAVVGARGDVLEIGFGTGLNLRHYPSEVRAVWGIDPMATEGVGPVERRIAQAPFPVERSALRADDQLPFDSGRFDCVVTTWTLCSIPDARAALGEMHRVLKPGGVYLFIEHGRSRTESTIRWQDRLNPAWSRFTDGCNINRPVDELVEQAGFELRSLDEFKGKGPRLISHLYRGVAMRS
ncbi:MAG: class I SAM-dependent methyltransferase [Deltaproteobacteria bacterium]|nr:class I SAM-dependent methyltransferase [Deltaproteobacteria bacterium]MBW2162361.1 class I SAM-dependent methyltransferase [Deltaproteobacteria bacterium]MBW2376675.1 class I SAM-dependent methyltransferase [Deltaproteobacteria bacterium]